MRLLALECLRARVTLCVRELGKGLTNEKLVLHSLQLGQNILASSLLALPQYSPAVGLEL